MRCQDPIVAGATRRRAEIQALGNEETALNQLESAIGRSLAGSRRQRLVASLEAKLDSGEDGKIWRTVAEPGAGPRGELKMVDHLVLGDEAQIERVLFSS